MTDAELILALYRARREAKAAKAAHRSAVDKLGDCVHPDAARDGHCWMGVSERTWCRVCAGKQPYYEDYQKKSHAAGTALQRVLVRGKALDVERVDS